MKISVQVKPNSKHDSVEELTDGTLLIRVNAPPNDNKANLRVIEILSKYFKVPKSKINLYKGPKSKSKIFEIR